MTALAATVRRTGAGLWVLATLAAVIVPGFVEVAAVHRTHWVGVGAGSFWAGFVVPWAARVWSLVVLTALAGWAATAASRHPSGRRRALDGVLGGLTGVAVCLLAALPAWIWLLRLGAAPAGALAQAFALSAAGPLVSGAVAGAAGAALDEAPAALAGAVTGGLVLWSTWGAMA